MICWQFNRQITRLAQKRVSPTLFKIMSEALINKKLKPIYEALNNQDVQKAKELVESLEYEITEAYAFSGSADEFGEKIEAIFEL